VHGVGAGVGGVGAGVGVVVQLAAPPMELWPSGHAVQSPFGVQEPAGAAVLTSQVHGMHCAAPPVA
jgi:hypothetical protein